MNLPLYQETAPDRKVAWLPNVNQSSPKPQNFGGARVCVKPDVLALPRHCVSISSRRLTSSGGSFMLSPFASLSTQLAFGRPRCTNACVSSRKLYRKLGIGRLCRCSRATASSSHEPSVGACPFEVRLSEPSWCGFHRLCCCQRCCAA